MPLQQHLGHHRAGADAACSWSKLSSADEALFRRHACAHAPPESYEHCWAFITQQTRLRGYKAVCGDVLAVAAIKNVSSPFAFLLPPVGPAETVIDLVPRLAASLGQTTGRRVVLRKAPTEWEADLRLHGFRRLPPTALDIAAEYPEDVYPQLVLDTAIARDLDQPKLQKTRNQLNVLRQNHDVSVEVMGAAHCKLLTAVVDEWAGTHNRNAGGDACERGRIADADAYHCLVDAFAHRVGDGTYFGNVMFIDEYPSGFCFAERSGARSASLYASLAFRIRGASEYLLVAFLNQLSVAGVQTVNLGGSETPGLFRFKRKFAPVRTIHTVELEYDPRTDRP